MTSGHKHRLLKVKRGGRLRRWLTKPTLLVSRNEEWVDRSRLVFGPVEGEEGAWRISPLGLLHGLTGLTLNVIDPEETSDDDTGH